MNKHDLVTLAESYAAHKGLTLSTVSSYSANDGKFFGGLKAAASCTLRRYDTVLRWFDAHWPDDLVWPPSIPRPSRKKDAA
jgi:hypothetical protein